MSKYDEARAQSRKVDEIHAAVVKPAERKVVSVAMLHDDPDSYDDFVAVCEDGSIWTCLLSSSIGTRWTRITGPPAEPTP